jgi:NADH-quinone oxidoreductase subunit L
MVYSCLWIIPFLPLCGFLVLALGGRRSQGFAAIVGAGTVAGSALLSLAMAARYLVDPPAQGVYAQTLWQWVRVSGFAPSFALHLDALSLLMSVTVTVVATLVLIYSAGFMNGDRGYSRFFAYMDLFVGCMLILVLARGLLLLYAGWEGVGLCSYLLIGFWYRDTANGRAARKAFIVTRLGDTALALGILLVVTRLHTDAIPAIIARAGAQWPVGSVVAVSAAMLLLIGALAKSAQLPLQVWLPDAMAGPTPVSALIHAATMVTAGVYLIARLHGLFALAPAVQSAVAVIGGVTLVVAGLAAVAQRDIKRVTAYSTISQVGYMFLALGIGAWSAAMYHFLTHAFFKSLLFLCAGVIIQALDGEHDLFRMGDLRGSLRITFLAFVVGALGLSGLPPTGGFASKDRILGAAFSVGGELRWLYAPALLGVFLTGAYTFRMLFLAFGEGTGRETPERLPSRGMRLALTCLAALSLVVAVLGWPAVLGGHDWLADFLSPVLGLPGDSGGGAPALGLSAVSVCVALSGAGLGWWLAVRGRGFVARACEGRLCGGLVSLCREGWGVDRLYDMVFVRPYVWLSRINRGDILDRLTRIPVGAALLGHRLASRTQTGRLSWYLACFAAGFIALLALVIWL